MKTVFINPERCIGCLQCEVACAVEHSTTQDEALAFLEVPVPRKRVHVQAGPIPTFAFPNRCHHCNPAPCVGVCPTGAIYRDDEHGVVLIDEKKCIGCATCALVCPFDVVTFHPLAEGLADDIAVAVKCDGCVARMRRGETPACVEVCKVDALVFGELNDLVAAGRIRETTAVLAAVDATPTPIPGGDPLAAWHRWGVAEASLAHLADRTARFSGGRGATSTNGHGEGSPSPADMSEGGSR